MGNLDDPRLEGKLLLLAGDFAAVLLLTAGVALSVRSGYRLDVDGGAVVMCCVLAAAASAVVHSLSRPWWSIGTAAAIAAAFWGTWEETLPVLQDIGQKMGLLPDLYLVWSGKREERLLPVFLLLCAALAWLMGWAAVRLRAWYLAALLAVAPVLPAIQMGVLPAWGAMLAAFAGWGSLLLTSLFRREDPDALGRARLLSLAGMGALILALVMALPMESYRRPQWATEARDSLILGVRRQMERFFDMDAMESGILADLGIDLSVPDGGSGERFAAVSGPGVSDSGPVDREDLLAAGPRRYSGRRALSVTTDQPDGGRIYLRGGSLGTYTGASWEMAEAGDAPFFSDEGRETETQPMLYSARTAADGTEYAMTIRDSRSGGARYYPYRLAEGRGWTDEAGKLTLAEDEGPADGFLPLQGSDYQVNYVPGGPEDGFLPLTGEPAEEEGRYRAEVVYGYRYLEVPDAARRTLEPLLNGRENWETIIAALQLELYAAEGDAREELEAQLQRLSELAADAPAPDDFGSAVELPEDAAQYQRPLTAASRTAALLAALAVYDPDTPAMEEGEDFVTHFLTEGRGYCIHFATAGALLLRLQGVPARYVTGYTVQLDGRGRGVALDSDAHAWVEIYLDGYGWYPVEMTPGYAGGETGVSLAAGEEAPDPPDEQAPEEETPEEELPEEAPGREEEPEEALPGEEGPEGDSGGGLWRALAGAGLTACGLGALYALALLLRRRERRNPDANRSVIRAYGRYERALRWGGAESGTLEELGRKARFSQHTLTEEEREAAWRSLDEAAEAARRGRKAPLRLLLALLRPLL